MNARGEEEKKQAQRNMAERELNEMRWKNWEVVADRQK